MKAEQRTRLREIPNTDGQIGLYVDSKLVAVYMKDYDGDMQKDLERITKLVEDDPNCLNMWL